MLAYGVCEQGHASSAIRKKSPHLHFDKSAHSFVLRLRLIAPIALDTQAARHCERTRRNAHEIAL
jgi:hypothetical protein